MAQDVATEVIMGLTDLCFAVQQALLHATTRISPTVRIDPVGKDLVKLLDADSTEPVPGPRADVDPELSALKTSSCSAQSESAVRSTVPSESEAR